MGFVCPGVDRIDERPGHAAPAGVVDVRVVLAGPAVGDELFHAAQRTHGVAGRPKCRARVFRSPALVVEHVGDGVHGFEACVGLHRTVAHAQYQHGRRGEALLHVDDHFLDLSGVVGVVVYPRLHDVEPVLQDYQVVTRVGVDLRIDRRVCPEHRLPVVAAHRVVVDHDAVGFEDSAVADEPFRPGVHLECQRTDMGRRDRDLPDGGGSFDLEFAAERIVERQFDAAVAGADEEHPCRGAGVEPLPVVGVFPPRGGALRGLAHPARDEEVPAQVLGRRFALHDVVCRPAFRLGFDRAPEGRQGRCHRGEARAAPAVGLLQLLAQVGREDVALDERVAQYGDAHRTAGIEQRVVECPEASRIGRGELLDRHERRVEPHRVGDYRPAAGAVLPQQPFEGGLHGAGRCVRFDALGLDAPGDLCHVDVEIVLVEERRFGGFRRGVLERQDVRQDVGPAELDAAEALRGDKTHGSKHCDQRQGRDPSPVGVVFFGGIHRPFSRVVRGSGRRSKAPRRWR